MRRALILVTALWLAPSTATAAESIGVITELHVKNGRVEVKPAAGGDWEPAKPLLGISAGDQVRAAGAGKAVLVFVSTQHTTVVTADNSPYVASLPPQPGFGERVKSAIAFLQSTPREPVRKPLTVRSSKDLAPVVILAPRETQVAADGFSLEWQGPESARYTVRIVAADGRVLWERKNAGNRPLALSPSDVRLVPGRYRWEIESSEHGIQRAGFDVATPEVASGARLAADAVEVARYPAATAALLKAAALMRERFYADARRELLRGVAASPDEPTLHVLLGDVYERTGLENLAAAEYDEAEALSVRR
jgi:hypothetical protein